MRYAKHSTNCFQKANNKVALVSLGFVWLFIASWCFPGYAQELIVSCNQPKQGQTVEVKLEPPVFAGSKDLPVVQFNQRTFPMFLANKNSPSEYWRALICIPADLSPGSYKFVAGNAIQPIKVLSGHFTLQKLRLPPGKDNFIASPGEAEAVESAKSTITNTQLWTGAFAQPCKARISTGFGLKRMVNGKLLDDYFHSGLDYAGHLGAPVYATQNGTVLLAHKNWRLHGNTICIDHGQGIVSFYIHLKDIRVKAGQTIHSGQIIGHVGSTGRVSGPNLHFSIYVNQVAANPADWFAGTFKKSCLSHTRWMLRINHGKLSLNF